MPFPLAHSLIGATLAEALLPPHAVSRNWLIAFVACLALLPDLDFLLVWLLHFDRDWHRGFTHSIAFALGCGGLMALTPWGRHRTRQVSICTLALMSHGLLDALTTINGRGVQLLWPVSSTRFKAEILAPTELGLPMDDVAQVLHYLLMATLIEAAILVPVFVAVLAIRRQWLSRPCTR
jgi:membrane-bound metal-dependent hydrolase YbcI (DUF457 family)